MSYTVIDNEIFDNEDLKLNSKALLMYLIRYDNDKDGYAYPSQKKLLDKTGLSKATLLKCLNELEEKGYIKRVKEKGVNNKYYINNSVKYSSTKNDTSIKNSSTKIDTTTSTKISTLQILNTNTNNKKEKEVYKDLSFIDLKSVKVTEEDYNKLIELAKGNSELVHDKMLNLEIGIVNKKKKYLEYKNHYLTLRQWINKDNKKVPTAIGTQNKNNNVNPSICKQVNKYTQETKVRGWGV